MMMNPNERCLRSKKYRALLYLNAKGKCEYCGNLLVEGWHVDHKFPWKYGGKTILSNLKASCQKCNLKKGSKMIEEKMKTANQFENMNHFENDFPNGNMKTANQFENMKHFENDFPNGNMRICQKGAYNCVVEKFIINNETTCSLFLPTGTGKSDVARIIAIGLVQKKQKYCGVWTFSPNTVLRKQLKENNVTDLFERINYKHNGYIPFMEIETLDNERFRNNSILESFTIQYLTAYGNINLFLNHAKQLYEKTGKYPIAIFDECHLCSCENEWGSAVNKLHEAGIPIILITGTPYRSDNLNIPGFKIKCVEITDKEENFTQVERITENRVVKTKGIRKVTKKEIEADYQYPYERAWEDKIIIKPSPVWVDGVLIRDEKERGKYSELSVSQQQRRLRSFLTDPKTIEKSVEKCIECLIRRKQTDQSCKAIVTSLSDSCDNEELCDIHASKIMLEFSKQAPNLKVLLVTSKNNSDDGLERFKKENYDVLIVKAMGTIGFDCKQIKTVLHLSNFRTLPGFVQTANRGCRLLGNMCNFDIIMPKDKGMKDLWQAFKEEHGWVLTEKEVIEITDTEEMNLNENKQEENLGGKEKYVKLDCSYEDLGRSKQDEIIDTVNLKFPLIANFSTNQEKIDFYKRLELIGGVNWMNKLPDFNYIYPQASDKLPLLDLNEEELRLRKQAREIVKEVTMEMINLLGKKYNSELYRDILKKIWSCVKRNCGFRSNQSIEKLSGIINFEKIVDTSEQLKTSIMKYDSTNFDYVAFLKIWRSKQALYCKNM